MKNSKCKICRRLGIVLFPKCKKFFARKPYPPGEKRKKRSSSLSEYGKELKEKQKLRYWYNLSEHQFRKYVKEVLEKRGKVEDASSLLIKKLERRLDNVIFRLGFATSRSQARQMITHRHFLINNKIINIPSYQVKVGDIITVKPSSRKKSPFCNLPSLLKKYNFPSWLKFDIKELKGEVVKEPSTEECIPPIEISSIFEYYSR